MNTPQGPAAAPNRVARRRFLRYLGLGAASAGAGAVIWKAWPDSDPPSTADDDNAGATTAAPVDQRLLVVIEMPGGNDGLSTLVPYGTGAYYDRRPSQSVAANEVLAIDDNVGLHPSLIKLADRDLAILQGVGTSEPDLSHFVMFNRWWTGDPAGDQNYTTGFLGRLCDELDAGAVATGVSLGFTPHPTMDAAKATTMALAEPDALWYLTEEEEYLKSYRSGLAALSSTDVPGGDPGPADSVRLGLADSLAFGQVVANLPEPADTYPETELGYQLALAGRLLAAEVGIRIIHVPMGGDFDTHTNHRDRHDGLMTELDGALDAFLGDLQVRGLDDKVLVATTSEFGRRLDENDGGLDHGTGSVAILAGPVTSGLHGEAPSLTELDETANIVATTTMEDYYATLAEGWFDISATDVLAGTPTPVPGMI